MSTVPRLRLSLSHGAPYQRLLHLVHPCLGPRHGHQEVVLGALPDFTHARILSERRGAHGVTGRPTERRRARTMSLWGDRMPASPWQSLPGQPGTNTSRGMDAGRACAQAGRAAPLVFLSPPLPLQHPRHAARARVPARRHRVHARGGVSASRAPYRLGAVCAAGSCCASCNRGRARTLLSASCARRSSSYAERHSSDAAAHVPLPARAATRRTVRTSEGLCH